MAKRGTSELGDSIGQPNTVNLTLSEISYPAVEMILEAMAEANGVIAYLSRARSLNLKHPDLLVRDGIYYLEVLGSISAESSRPWQTTAGH